MPDVRVSTRFAPLAAAVVALAAWETAVRAVNAAHPAVPAPSTIVGALAGNLTLFGLNLQPTLLEAGLGFLFGSLAGVVLAVLLFAWSSAEGSLYRLVVTVHSIPLLAIAPLLVIWFGVGSTPVVIMAAMACFFPTTVNVNQGLRAVDPSILEMFRLLDAPPLAVLLKARLPAALPHLLAALKIGAPSAVLGATIGEWLGSRGLGYLLFSSMVNFDPPLLWATMVVCSALALLGFGLFELAERRLTGWHESARSVEGAEG